MRIAALDLGSNSFHLLVVEARPDGTFTPLAREKVMLRLGDAVSRTGAIPPELADEVVSTLARMRSLSEAAGADEIHACATSAMREADNSSELVDRIAREAGIDVRVISGDEEARLIFGAVRASLVLEPAPAVCLDLGGGSLEVTVGDAGRLAFATSVKLGVARLTADCVRNDPPSAGDLRRLRKRVTDVFGPVAEQALAFEPGMLVGTSGTLCDLVRMAAVRRDGEVPLSVNQLTVERSELEQVHKDIIGRTSAERRKLDGLEPRRADLAPAGSTLGLVAMDLLGLDRLTAGAWALREGIVLDAIARHDPVDWSPEPRAIRRSSVLDLCRRCSWDQAHGEQVARLSTTLFDATADLHGLGSEERELLELAALLHDIGELVAAEGHERHTAYLVEHGRLRGFAPDEVDVLASLGRFHVRGELKATFRPYERLGEDRRADVRALAGILRVADGLDRGGTTVVRDVAVRAADDVLHIDVASTGDIELELWGARRKAALLEKVLGRRVELHADGGV